MLKYGQFVPHINGTAPSCLTVKLLINFIILISVIYILPVTILMNKGAPLCFAQGDTIDEAVENIKDAIKLHIEARESLEEPVPVEVLVDEVEVSV